ncbi:uncharacterized protein LOC113773067 [Coffea eugenioides]|uniref:uncharacterized protein LOC113773067 n=1 Tax=Coffea eugenioides TaxID=49369 RepID=UPI000F607DEC|nr:uncharacterized protein LOC113773067 [Coffea eugenioides]
MEVESTKKISSSQNQRETRTSRRWRRKTVVVWAAIIGVILVVGLVMLILGLTVFKAKRPVTTVNSVSLRDIDVSVDVFRLRVLLNVTLDANIAVNNPNRVGFHYANSTAILKYRGQDVGQVPIPAGHIGPRQTLPMNITLTLMADRLLSNSNLYRDVLSGTLPLTTFTRISGYVRILFKIHVVSYTTCDLDVDVGNRRLTNQTCHYRTKL